MYFSYEKKHRLLLFLAKEIHTVIFLLKKCQKELEGIQYGYNAIAEIVCTYDSYMYHMEQKIFGHLQALRTSTVLSGKS